MPKLAYHNTAALMRPHAHGTAHKDLIVLHETVSGDAPGWSDINSVEAYLASKDYGIHGMTDAEGNIAWAYGLGKAVFWQAGGVNDRSIGIEQVSNVMLRSPYNSVRRKIWVARNAQLHATAKLCAAIADAQGVPLVYSNGLVPGVTSHWDVSQHFAASEGHTDCWPVKKGGYYPIGEVITLAKGYKALGFHF
jgi:hypothetical protein